jgi:hypothetical protein
MTYTLLLLGRHPYTLDAGHLDDDVMLGFDGDDGVCCHLDTT